MTGVNWDAMNQAARANEASRKSAEAVCAFAEALAERLEVRAHDPFAGPESSVYAAVARDVRDTVASLMPVSRPAAGDVDRETGQCMNGRCLRNHDTMGRHA